MSNVIKFKSTEELQEKRAADGRAIEVRSMDALDASFSEMVNALMVGSEYRAEEDAINPWLLLESYYLLCVALNRDACDVPEWQMLRELCDYITASEDTQS